MNTLLLLITLIGIGLTLIQATVGYCLPEKGPVVKESATERSARLAAMLGY